jgi:hypothetical protein
MQVLGSSTPFNKKGQYNFPMRSSFPSSPSRSAIWTQIILAKFLDVKTICAQYLPSTIIPRDLSYTFSLPRTVHKPSQSGTTEPNQPRNPIPSTTHFYQYNDLQGNFSYEFTPRFQTSRLMHVIAVAQPPANNNGKTIFGVTDP